MKVLVSNLSGVALNYAVATVLWGEPYNDGYLGYVFNRPKEAAYVLTDRRSSTPGMFDPLNNGNDTLDVILSAKVEVSFRNGDAEACVVKDGVSGPIFGGANLQASILRAAVHSCEGDEIEIPSELLG
ncbi:hypothetical protein ACFOY8_12870 [Thalassospira xianhensis]|uniref:Uncharacterized protein n=1 Tax=Thalassospira xianhensis MCCC 1A02616 TaxID=1177929 RepID=A0A367UIM0_9PROT|nr:hypothetical protein [Thalassospira xianhensis]RCK07880.1 hypothetical protein TH5_02420 [Thalassospira xianhensis MCCC 1A02616]